MTFDTEVAAGRATHKALAQQTPEAPPIGELQSELILGVRAWVRRTASMVPHPRPAERFSAVISASIPAVFHRTRLRWRYQGVEAAAERLMGCRHSSWRAGCIRPPAS